MRFKMSGVEATLIPPPIVLTLSNGVPFVPGGYIDLGYTNFDVMCIGAAGGYGGRYGWATPGFSDRVLYGGAGGGGGAHRVQGLLSALGASETIVVGARGVNGTSPGSSSAVTGATNGSDGGYSAFGVVCKASGGKGGLCPTTVVTSPIVDSLGRDGGAGGVGNSITAGGGAVQMTNGTWDGTIGQGGGGGKGGIIDWTPSGPYFGASGLGGYGSYNTSDLSVYGPTAGSLPHPFAPVPPGMGGGAKAFPLTGLSTVWGGYSPSNPDEGNGLVVIRLTKE